jgi:hypothetical protein
MMEKVMWRLGVVSIPIARLFFALLLAAPTHPAISETIQLQRQGGAYMVPVGINETIILPFVVDSGAAEVSIPTDLFLTLLRSGTVKQSDFVGNGRYVLVDGSEQSSERFILHEVRVGDHVVRNVVANVAPVKGDPLLGQSFLSKLPAWTIDNQRHALVFNDAPAAVGTQQRAALPPAQVMPSAPIPAQPAVSTSPSAGELVERGLKAAAQRNYSEAMRWFQMAAAQGSALAQYDIGALYENGWGVPWDHSEAMRWFRLAATQGNANAEANIGLLYLHGWGVTHDYSEAMRWFQMAAAQGNATAQNGIGVLYKDGLGVSQDYAEAMRWFRLAADKGVAQAQYNVGGMVARGQGALKDCTVARQWLERAAASGFAQAQLDLRYGVDRSCQLALIDHRQPGTMIMCLARTVQGDAVPCGFV